MDQTSMHEAGLLGEETRATVLVVDDQSSIRRALARRLDDQDLNSLEAASGSEALECVRDEDVDLVLLDIGMPDMDGYDVLESLREDFELSELPIIMLTGREEEGDVLKALELGASDYVTKDTDFQIAMARIRTQLQFKQAMDRIVEVSRMDELTGLPNRRAFYEHLEDEQGRFERKDQVYSLVMMDIDHFKDVNDTHGHSAGDRVLQEFADRLQSTVRGMDVLGRFGGEEFILLLPETGYEGAQTLAEKLREVIAERPFDLEDQEVGITASFGVTAQTSESPREHEELIKEADQAMYEAKTSGRNCVKGKQGTPS